MTQPAPYESLTPDTILDALESVGLEPSGSLLALNSYENRVYQAGLEDQSFIVVKFYRPERWSDSAIAEEHQFTQTLFDEELSVVTPVALTTTAAGRQTVFQHGGFRFAVFARQGGHPPNLENLDDLEVLSRTIARMHAVGARQPFEHRPQINVQRFGHDSRNFLLENNFLPPEMEAAYATVSEHLLQRIEPLMINVPNVRIHGDCHMGNILWRDDVPHFVDFDDCMMGPPIQDLWMLLSGERYDQTGQLATVLDAYNDFFSFDVATLGLIEPLRTLRIMHHAAWIARRWHDPGIPSGFPLLSTALITGLSMYWSYANS
jgi:Ser/Thr protein kinase RdoA (MazF antagonist)